MMMLREMAAYCAQKNITAREFADDYGVKVTKKDRWVYEIANSVTNETTLVTVEQMAAIALLFEGILVQHNNKRRA